MKQENKSYALPIVIMILLFGMISFVTGLANPMGVITKNQFAIKASLATLGYLANFIAYAFMGYPAGMMLHKRGYTRTALWAILVGFAGVGIMVLSGLASSYVVYLVGAFVGGFSMCMLNTVVNPMLNTLGGGGNKGNQLIQVGGSFNSLRATIVPVLVGYLIGGQVEKAQISDAYPALYLAMGIFALAFIVLFLANIPEPSLSTTTAVKREHSIFAYRHFVLGAIAIFLYVGVEVGVQNFINPYLTDPTEKGGWAMDPTIAGSVVGTYWFLMLIGRLVGAAIGGKVSSRLMLTVVSLVGALLTVGAIMIPASSMSKMPVFLSSLSFGIVEIPVNVILLVLIGLCTSVMWGGIYNLAVEGLGKYTEAASGFFMVMVCGGGILPFVQGLFVDSVGYINSYWIIFAALAYLLFYALIGSRNVNKDIPVA